jgi:hypothetical protein
MKLKKFLALCISTILGLMPQNIIGCGAEIDAYDYYTSFFHNTNNLDKNYKPFYYTGYNYLYTEEVNPKTIDVFANEWRAYASNAVNNKDVKEFLLEFAAKDVSNLYFHLEKNKTLNIPDSVKKNSFTKYFFKSQDFEALGYIMFSKKLEQFVGSEENYWVTLNRDTAAMGKLIKNGFQLLAAAKNDFIKQRYVYQILRLGLYGNRNADVINWYNEYATFESKNSIKNLCSALKAGALFRMNEAAEAAYLFSKCFFEREEKKLSNFLSFRWSSLKTKEKDILAFCKNNNEAANVLSLLAMHGIKSEVSAIEKIYKLNTNAPALKTLVTREINKIENFLLSKTINNSNKSTVYWFYSDSITKAALKNIENNAGSLKKSFVECYQ